MRTTLHSPGNLHREIHSYPYHTSDVIVFGRFEILPGDQRGSLGGGHWRGLVTGVSEVGSSGSSPVVHTVVSSTSS